MQNITAYFIDYEEDTLDPGWSFIVGSFVACLLLHATLPCLVSLGSRYETRRTETKNRDLDHQSVDDAGAHPSRVVLFGMNRLEAIAESETFTPNHEEDSNLSRQADQTVPQTLNEPKNDDNPVVQDEKSYATIETSRNGDSLSGILSSCFGGGGSVAEFLYGLADTVSSVTAYH